MCVSLSVHSVQVCLELLIFIILTQIVNLTSCELQAVSQQSVSQQPVSSHLIVIQLVIIPLEP